MKNVIFVFVIPFLLSCSDGDFPKVTKLEDLRIISVVADHPEVAPGDSVSITPLISDINGAGRSLTYSVVACSDPGISHGASPTCNDAADRISIVSGATVTGLSAPNYTGYGPSVSVTVPATQLTGRNAVDQYNGIAYLVFYSVTDGTVTVSSMKRVMVSGKTVKNANPTVNSILSNGVALSTLPTINATLTPDFASGSQETYTFLYKDGSQDSRTETLVTSWFTTDGLLDHDQTGNTRANVWTPPTTAPTGRSIVLIAVTRDQRAGESSKIVTIP